MLFHPGNTFLIPKPAMKFAVAMFNMKKKVVGCNIHLSTAEHNHFGWGGSPCEKSYRKFF
jgi:hypothetical protein